MKDNLI